MFWSQSSLSLPLPHTSVLVLLSLSVRLRLVGDVKNWEDRKWWKDKKYFNFSLFCLVGSKKWRDKKTSVYKFTHM